MNNLPPFLIFFLGALIIPFVRGGARAALLLTIPIVGAVNLWTMPEGFSWSFQFFDYTLTPLRLDPLSLLFGYLFHLGAFLAILFALHVRDAGQQVASLLYVGGALGAVFAGDLITLFVFWELLAISSVFLIWARRTPKALAAGLRYLLIQVLSGRPLVDNPVTAL